MRNPLDRLGAAVGLLAAFAACNPGFSPQSFIDKPRVLGIRADPPEVQFTSEEQGSVTLTAFLALPEPPKDGPPGPRELASLEWTVCFLDLGAQAAYQCGVPEGPVDSDLATRTATLDTALLYAQIDLLKPLFPQFIEAIKQTVKQTDTCEYAVINAWDACKAAHPADPTPCVEPGFTAEKACLLEKGRDVTFHLKATWTDGTDDFVVDAYKKVYLRRITAERPANKNPAFSVWLNRTSPLDPAWITATAAPSPSPVVVACPGQKVTLETVLDDGARETFTDSDGTTKVEDALVSWFTTAGEFERLKSATATARPGDPIDLKNVLTMPKRADFPDSFPVWVFVREDRLGLDQVQFQVQPRDDASCTRPAGAPKGWKPPEPEVLPVAPGLVKDARIATTGGAA